jgi:uncharacterized membrane protein YuzA (DUF378 family)
MNAEYILVVIWNLILIGLFLTTYAYIDHLEKIGCECATHPYRNFVKWFPLWAVAYIIIFMFLPFNLVESIFGSAGAMIHATIVALFGIVAIVFFVLAFIYTRWLMMEKCKCSEDIRRDVIYWWSMLTIILLVAAFVLMLGTSTVVSNRGVNLKAAVAETSRLGRSTLSSPRERLSKINKGFRSMRG